jgi:hypothetical protein
LAHAPKTLNRKYFGIDSYKCEIFAFRRLECTVKKYLTLLARAVDASKVKVWVEERNMPAA